MIFIINKNILKNIIYIEKLRKNNQILKTNKKNLNIQVKSFNLII